MISKYLHSIVQIVDRGLKSNSYKFALLRALSDFGKQKLKTDSIDFEWLAERFIGYYWPLTVKFRVRQATDASRDPVIMRFIRDELKESGIHSPIDVEGFKKCHASKYMELVRKCCNRGGCFDEVVPRFHNLGPGTVTPVKLYSYTSKQLKLEDGVADFLSEYHHVLFLLAVGGWVRFTEQFTFAPKLYEKIAGNIPIRKHERYRRFLKEVQGEKCFYCQTEKETAFHVDHVIPWSFVLEDRVWNLVLACKECNVSKSDRIPDVSHLRNLNVRNAKLISEIRTLTEPLSGPLKRDFEAFTADALESHVTTLARNCRDDGFGEWAGRSR